MFEVNQKGNITIVKVKGKLDSILAPVLEKQIFQHLKESQNKLILDLGEVFYINSSGLRMLLSIKKQIKILEGSFVVCSVRSEVLEMLKICGFDHVFEISKNQEEALNRF